jgi:alkylated DNA repair dioxygenase AlkB
MACKRFGLPFPWSIPYGVNSTATERTAGLAEQLALFADKSELPEGLGYSADFISAPLERELVARVTSLRLQPFQFGQYEGKRRVASFGTRYDYSLRRLLPTESIPVWLTALIEQVEAFGGRGTRIAQILCTEYDSGVGIGWHRDKPQFDRIFGISLGSQCKLRFRKAVAGGWKRVTLDVAPRSIYVMAGPVRRDWEHSILAVEKPRYSLTLRTLKANPDILSSEQSNV